MVPTELLVETIQQRPQVYQALLGLLLFLGALQYYLGPKADWVQGHRANILRSAHEFLTIVGAYGVGESSPHEYSVTIFVDEDELKGNDSAEDVVERKLYGAGFHRNVLACKKFRVTDSHRQWADGSWVHRTSFLAERQLHATLYAGPVEDGRYRFDVYCHEEPSNIRKPLKHLVGVGQRYDPATRTTKRLLDEANVEYTVDNPHDE